jgi:N-acetylglutamate synthase/N-acetylornithine aminotransferase
VIRSENKAHEAACIFSEMQRQAAMATAFTTAAVKSADIAHYRRIIASAKLNGVPYGVFVEALEFLGTGGT